MGGDNLLWASDYPHADSTWPNSRQVVEQVRRKMTPETANRYLHENCETLFGLHSPANGANSTGANVG
jgi:predicted TIM-barrel fold metal-dependent hydrolase